MVFDGRAGSPGGEPALAGGLTLAAVSSEAGAIYAVAFVGFRLGARAMLGPRGPRALAWLALPLLVGGAVLVLLARGRAGTFEGIGAASPLLHHPLRGLGPAAWDLLAEFTVPPAKGRHLGLDLLAKALFVAGVWGCWAPSRRAAPPAASDLLAAGLAPLVTAYGLLVTAYYEFGQVCCDRHATLRQALFVLALAALAVGLHRAVAPPLRLRAAAPLLLAAAAAIPAALDGAALRHDFALAPAAVAVRRANWGQGLAPGDAMAFRPPPPMRIVRGFQLPAGSYDSGAGYALAGTRHNAVLRQADPDGPAAALMALCARNVLMPALSRRSLLVLSAAAGIGLARSARAAEATTVAGRVAGTEEGAVRIWRGVPFAQTPDGSLRFRPPLPPLPWAGVRPASAFARAPIQAPAPSSPPAAPARTACI